MSPATYLSYEIQPDDDAAEQRRKLYLGVISAGEQAYTLGAAIAECRKKLDDLDRTVKYLHDEFHKRKNTWAAPGAE